MSIKYYYEIKVRHNDLNKYRHIRGTDRYVVEQKAAALQNSWDEMWAKRCAAEQKRKEKEHSAKKKEEKKQLAVEKTNETEEFIKNLENTLQHTLNINDAIDWDSLLDKSEYPENKPKKLMPVKIPTEPKKNDPKFDPQINFFDHFIPPLKKRKIRKAKSRYEVEHYKWKEEKESIENNNKTAVRKYESDCVKWENKKKLYIEKRNEKNNRILEKKKAYFNKEPDSILDYCEMVLANSKYPETFPQQYDLDYNLETKILLVDYFLPSKENIPTLKEVKYIISQDKFKEVHISETAFNKLYDSLLYQIALRTIHELYEADIIEMIDSIVFNGFVKFIDKAIGQEATSCILSIQAKRDEFLAINLANIDPKLCFKRLKGVGSSKLHGLAPVAPIMKISKEDRRFISPYDIADSIEETTNIAAMDWKDFENLIREVFEKEFSDGGGEVKITQASKDGGVDAVAFDPDPIRGGKIVIQAKRYTNVVGVSAIRDLYGTVVNEGAIKGILVTTADYGPDSYEFAKDKPLTLLNGSNLLHLLEKYGHKAKIDIKEAKKILAERN
jgi:restriction system protein